MARRPSFFERLANQMRNAFRRFAQLMNNFVRQSFQVFVGGASRRNSSRRSSPQQDSPEQDRANEQTNDRSTAQSVESPENSRGNTEQAVAREGIPAAEHSEPSVATRTDDITIPEAEVGEEASVAREEIPTAEPLEPSVATRTDDITIPEAEVGEAQVAHETIAEPLPEGADLPDAKAEPVKKENNAPEVESLSQEGVPTAQHVGGVVDQSAPEGTVIPDAKTEAVDREPVIAEPIGQDETIRLNATKWTDKVGKKDKEELTKERDEKGKDDKGPKNWKEREEVKKSEDKKTVLKI